VISLDSLVLQFAGALSSVTLMRLAAHTGPGPVWYLAGSLVAAASLACFAIQRRTRVAAPAEPVEALAPVASA
jgi:hypothetical protein